MSAADDDLKDAIRAAQLAQKSRKKAWDIKRVGPGRRADVMYYELEEAPKMVRAAIAHLARALSHMGSEREAKNILRALE